ncbi:T9SS C-terminal target domain-containing protein [Flavobacterium sp. K5-23]|uniref:T9SS C-terminal target domain-containing protein n=1 Tax=Flavobacterium sp. K5-23 TaxID=2746225 RepID=UPI00200CB9A5|nr:T9SS C-terminal target domain-containing protein [Flavobacterium sp. K5-23]UQD57470.1 T9SS C-terminal target domain-containing protein [Flavobacterium sp. K5-23]
MKILSFLILLLATSTYAQIAGCTDPLSKNYNARATVNDGSCEYNLTRVKPTSSTQLNDELNETSGLVNYDSLLWTINDDKNTTLYGIDKAGGIQKEIKLHSVINSDWEEISQDSSYIYIGDFGNNYYGNRENLHILRVEKESLYLDIPKIDTISFSYSNQLDYIKAQPNTTNFDCEAFIVSRDSIYLFTKQWEKEETSVYVLPKTPGNYVAELKTAYNINGLITGATYLEYKKLIVLSGYSHHLSPFLYLLYDYKSNDFFSGNKRKIKLRLAFHQIEGITTQDGLHYLLTNEQFVKKPFLNIPQKLHEIDLSLFLKSYINQ